MDKEILTDAYLKKLIRAEALGYIPFVPIFLLLLWPMMYQTINANWAELPLACLFLLAMDLMFVGLLVYVCYDMVDGLICASRKPVVLIDKRIEKPVGEREVIHRRRRPDLYIMQFRDNGKLATTNRAIWESTFPGDMFYVVMRRPRRIMFAFPCNDYFYDGQLSQIKYVDGKPVFQIIKNTEVEERRL